MTKKDLIKQLENISDDTIICVAGYEGGLSELKSVTEVKIAPNPAYDNDYIFGEFEETNKSDAQNAVFLSAFAKE